jgi:hypothetical protein
MAQMYPDKEHFDQQNVPSAGERIMYDALRTQLDDNYIVFHSVNWKAQGKKKPYDGEADFVIAHATEGILTLEVKGGGIRYIPSNDRWSSIDKHGMEHSIKNPFDQARSSRYTLRDALYTVLPQQQVDAMTMGEAVAFPNIVLDDTLPGLDKPSELILDLHDVDDISKWVQRAFKYHRGKRPVKDTAPGRQAIQKLSKQLVGDGPVLLLVPKWDTMTSETGKLLELTEQQYNILDGFAQHTRVAVSGCAGSGKTMLAFHKATQLAEQGQRVLLTCFNKNLADDLRVRAGDMPNLDIAHFHRVAVGMMNQAGIECHDKRDATFFRETIPGLMLDALDQLPEHRYDAIIVDEAQDFEDSWWEPIQFLLRDMEQSILYIFYDSNQNIFVEQSNFPIQTPPYLLTANCRNTQHIHQQVLAFYTGSPPPKLRGPQGWPVEVIDIGNPQQLRRELLKKLTGLVSGDLSKIPSDEIVVLTPFAKEKSHLWGKALSTSSITLTDTTPVPPGKVYCTTVQSFKGLESSVVVLAEFERWPHGLEDTKRLLYIASSRARNHLIVFLTDDASDDVRALFTGESS